MLPCVPDGSVDKHVYHECQGSWVQTPWKAVMVFPFRKGVFNDLTFLMLPRVTARYIALPRVTARYITLPRVTSRYRALHRVTARCLVTAR